MRANFILNMGRADASARTETLIEIATNRFNALASYSEQSCARAGRDVQVRRVIPGAVDQLAPDDQFDLTQLDSDHASGSDSESSDRESSEFTVGGNPKRMCVPDPSLGRTLRASTVPPQVERIRQVSKTTIGASRRVSLVRSTVAAPPFGRSDSHG